MFACPCSYPTFIKLKCELKKALESRLVNCGAFELRQLLRRADFRSKGNKLTLFIPGLSRKEVVNALNIAS